MRIPLVTAIALVSTSNLLACDVTALQERLAAIDEHLFWFEFWQEIDEREASSELDYAIHDLSLINAGKFPSPACSSALPAQPLLKVVEIRLVRYRDLRENRRKPVRALRE